VGEVVVLLVIVLLFGAQKLARSSGEAMGEFQKGREAVERELQQLREGEADEEPAGAAVAQPERTTTECVRGKGL
jgi:sec-independent protein translocase protein TatA